MKPTALLLTTLLTTASAATLPNPLPPRRHLRLLHTLPSADPITRILSSTLSSSESTESTESTRGGAVLTLPSSPLTNPLQQQKITTLQGTFRLPHAEPPTSGPTAGNPVGVYAASFWLGLDSGVSSSSPSGGNAVGGLFGDGGDECSGSSGKGNGVSLRAGIDIFHDGTLGGEQRPFAWYQFSPSQNTETGFADFGVAPGDLVRITVENGEGEVAVEVENFGPQGGSSNSSSGGAGDGGVTEDMAPLRTARKTFPVSDGGGEGALCGREAAWMVEDFPLDGLPDVPVALANFTSVTFAQAGVELADGSKRDVGGDGVELMDVRLEAQGGRLTECEIAGDGEKVTCKRVVGDEE